MRVGLKWFGIVIGSLFALVLVAALTAGLYSQLTFKRAYNRPVYAIEADVSPEGLARGEYLVRVVGGCVDCHSEDPLNPDFAGSSEFVSQGPISFVFAPANITQDKETGIGDWTDAEIGRAIREGLDKDGHGLVIMPSFNYRILSDADVAAIVGYLRTIEPVYKEIPPISASIPGKALFAFGLMPNPVGDPITEQVMPPSQDRREYGQYLATVAGCRDCHGINLDSIDPMNLPPGTPSAPNITASGNVGDWTEEEFVTALQTGQLPTGRTLSEGMPWKIYGQMTDDDLGAIYQYLISLPELEIASAN